MKKKLTIENIKRMRSYGMTYQQIGDYYGVSKQYVNQLCPAIRKYDIEKIKYKPFYDLFCETPDLTVSRIAKMIFGKSFHSDIEKTRRFLRGDNILLSLKQIDNIEEIIQMPIKDMLTQKRY